MKIIARTLAILTAALVVAGIAYALSQTSLVQGLESSMRPAGGPPHAQSADAATSASDDTAATLPQRPEGGEHDQSPSLAGGVEVLKSLAIVGVIVALISLGGGLVRRLAGGRGPRPPTPMRAA